MRNRSLHAALAAFAEEAGWQLASATADGAEVPFEVVESGRRDAPLYCYRPLTADFIAGHVGLLGRLPSYLPAVHALHACGRLDAYLERRGGDVLGWEAPPGRERAEAALRAFLGRVFEDSTDFALSHERLDAAYAELEDALYDERTETVVVAPLHGLELASPEIPLGEGLVLVQADALLDEAPRDALWAASARHGQLLAVLRWEAAPGDASPVAHARVRLRRLLVALRLFDAGGAAFGALAWTRTGGGAWQPFALGALGHRAIAPVSVAVEQEDELRAFCSLVTRRTPRAGEIAWALRRFELACDRPLAGEALTDLLLAARALLEPEGPASGRLAGRLAALCALPEQRAALTERVARAVALERSVIGGLAVDGSLEDVVADLGEHVRALLRDVLCGHLDSDLRSLADQILADDAELEPDAAAEPVERGGEAPPPLPF